MSLASSDDLQELPHVVVVESTNPATLRIAEFDCGALGQKAAHEFAQNMATQPGVHRVLVTARYRTLGKLEALEHTVP